MHFIDQGEIEFDLPNDWVDVVASAWTYVNKKEDDAEQAVSDHSIGKDWDVETLREKVLVARVAARKKAITAKNTVWSKLSSLLSEQSAGKCWYCETNEIRSDNPIDHYRPKNNVKECSDHPGYWWLAFDWKNYRYACTYCNSRRVGVDTSGGKQDHFPVFMPPGWNQRKADENVEKPMLLDPIESHDCLLLTFNSNGEACATSDDESSEDYLKATKSIELYHLNHQPTTRERKVILHKIGRLISSTNELISSGINENSDAIKGNKIELFRLIRPTCKSTKFNTAAKIYLRQYEANDWVKDILDRA